MFAKLLKYDLKSMVKTMLPLWIAVLCLAFIMGISTRITQFQMTSDTFYDLTDMIYPYGFLILSLVAVFIAIFVLNILIVIRRFWDGLLKDEGYLMFTIPTTPRKLILSKVVSAMIISSISMIVGILVVNIIFFCSTGHAANIFGNLAEIYNMLMENNLGVLVIFNLIFSLLVAIYRVYAAMAIGHLSNRNRFIFSFIAYVALDFGMAAITAPLQLLYLDQMDSEIMISVTGLISKAVMIIVFHVITEVILTTRLNLE